MSDSNIHTVPGNIRAEQLVGYCAQVFGILGSKSAVKKAINEKRLLVNGRPARYTDRIKSRDRLELIPRTPKAVGSIKFDQEVPIVYEDDWLIVINKPGGIAVNGNRNKTIENVVANFAKKSPAADALPKPRAVHRIDVPTKGLVLLAKTKKALILLSKAFQEGKVKKEYTALVHGKAKEKGRINSPIQGKESITEYTTLRTVLSRVYKSFSLLRLFPLTGRTHQLRIHLNEVRHLIVGDKQYAGRRKTILGKGLFLCASRLTFQHPISNEELDLSIDIPVRFEKLLDREATRFSK